MRSFPGWLHVLAAAGALAGGTARAAEAAPKQAEQVEALKAEVKELRKEVEALKAVKAAAPAVVPASAPAVIPASTPGTQAVAQAQAALEERVEALEVQHKDSVVVGDLPGSFRVPGTDVSMRLYGFVELNYVHDFAGDNSDSDYSTFAPYLPLNHTALGERTNRDYLTGRTSRIGIDAGTPTKYGVLGVKFEGDFNNEPRTGNASLYGTPANVITQQQTNSYGFRVRHLYGQFGGLLIGQTWSTFQDVDNFPETVDYNGPIGQTFIRQPQIRYTYGTPNWGNFTAALENSSTYMLDGSSSNLGGVMSSSLSRMPDFILRWDRGFDWGAVSVRAMTQDLHVSDGASIDASKRGWGGAASASFKTFGDDLLFANVTGGYGIGRYLNYIEGAVYDPATNAVLVESAIGGVVGYQYKPTGWVRVNFAYGLTKNFDNDYTTFAHATGLDSGRFGINRWVHQAHVGPIFTVYKGVDLGLEGIYANRVTVAGERGDGFRFNFSAKYYVN
jgi:DcaP outer membrane protein